MKVPETSRSAARFALVSGAILCFLAVAFGAFGAHALESHLLASGRLEVYETANQYHFYHSIALIAVGSLASRTSPFRSLYLVSHLLVMGTLIFSGSLYLLAITNFDWLGTITPIGGLLLLAAWLVFCKDALTTQQ